MGLDNVIRTWYKCNVTMREKGKIMGKVKSFIMDVEEFVWDFFDEDGNFVADEKVKSKEDLMIVVKEKSELFYEDVMDKVIDYAELNYG